VTGIAGALIANFFYVAPTVGETPVRKTTFSIAQ
jgi:hypothetical protein